MSQEQADLHRKSKRDAWDLVSSQPQAVLDAVALVVENAKHEGDYTHDDDGGSFWQESAGETLACLATTIRRMKEIHDPADVLDPF